MDRSKPIRIQTWVLLGHLMVLCLQSPAVHAQDTDRGRFQLEEIIVTAQKRSANVQDVPISISVFDGNALESGGVARLEDIVGLAPNVYVNFNDSIRATAISIRGILSDPNNVGIDPAVGVYVDGVYMARPTTVNAGLYDLERVEILRGPQGTIFGKNTIAGAIHFISRKPDSVPEFAIAAKAGSYDYQLLRVSGNAPVSDSVAVRGSVQYEKRDGLLENLAGPDNNDLDNLNARLALRYAPSEDLEWLFRVDAAKDQTHAGASEVLVPSPLFAGPPFNSPQDVDPWDRVIKDAESSHQDRDLIGGSAEVNWSIGPGTITSITAYRAFQWDNFQTSDNTEFDIFGTGIIEDEHQFSQEIRYAGSANSWDYVGGIYYFTQRMDAEAFARVGVDVPAVFGAPALGLNPAPGSGFIDIHTENDSWAAFGQLDYHVNDALTLTAGIRYTTEDKRISHQLFADPTGMFVPNVPLSDFERTDNEPSYLAGIKYAFTPDAMAYMTYSHGFKAGGYNAFSFNLVQADGTPADFEPELVDNFELGFKTSWLERRLQLNAALFSFEYQDLQVNQLIQNNQGIIDFNTSNAAQAKGEGIEIELMARPTELLTFALAYGYADATYDSFPGATPAGDDYSGNQLAQSPKNSLSAVIGYERPITDRWHFIAQGELIHRDERFSDPSNDPLGLVDGYEVVNARLGVASQDDRFGIYAWARNLFDKDYAIQYQLGSGAFSPGALFQSIGNQRTYGVEFSYRWTTP